MVIGEKAWSPAVGQCLPDRCLGVLIVMANDAVVGGCDSGWAVRLKGCAIEIDWQGGPRESKSEGFSGDVPARLFRCEGLAGSRHGWFARGRCLVCPSVRLEPV